MIFNVFTLFPEMIVDIVNHSILKRAIEKGSITVNTINIRDFAGNKYGQVDDYPYGGGAGMLMQVGPVVEAFEATKTLTDELIYMSAKGKVFNQKKAKELSQKEEVNILCGHYEGIDQRAIDIVVSEEISIGDYVLTGGELAATVLIDSISRLLDGVLGSDDSAIDESHQNRFLEYPQYTRPYDYRGHKVPDILLSGHHENIKKWREEQAIKETILKRRDLINEDDLTPKEKEIVEKILDDPLG